MKGIHSHLYLKGVDGTVVFFLERMEVKWGGWRDFRVRKDTPCRVPPLF